MRKILLVFFISILAFGLVACGKREKKAEYVKTIVETSRLGDDIAATENEPVAVEEVVEEESQVETETTSEEAANVEYTYTDLSENLYVASRINVRDIPDQSGQSLGQLDMGEELTITGQCNETGWYRIDYDGQVGYVSNDYVAEERPGGKKQDKTPEDAAAPDDMETVQIIGGELLQ